MRTLWGGAQSVRCGGGSAAKTTHPSLHAPEKGMQCAHNDIPPGHCLQAQPGDDSLPAGAWGRRAGELAAWTMDRLVVQDDCYGLYAGTSGSPRCKEARLTNDVLERHFRGE